MTKRKSGKIWEGRVIEKKKEFMMLSEIIKELQQHIDKHGDVKIQVLEIDDGHIYHY